MASLISRLSSAWHSRGLLLAGAILATAFVPASTEGTPGGGIVLKPGAVWTGRDRHPAQLRYDWAYLFRRDIPGGLRIPLPRAGAGWTVALSPGGGLVAYDLSHIGESGINRESPANYEIAVSDTSGRDVASFAGGVRLAWSEDGTRLAVAIGCAPWAPVPAFDSVVVWEPGKGTTLSRRVPPSRGSIGWAGPDTLLIGSSAVACRTGAASPSSHRGTNVSPDGLYSVYPTGGIGLGVSDDRTGSNFAYSIVDLLRLPKLGRIGRACWLRAKGHGHILAISACTPSGTAKGGPRDPECLTGLVDVKTRRLIGWTRGRLVGPTADSREVVIARDSVLSFVGDGAR